ncbi:MAG: hypothetical protein LBI84_08275 [Propionibacteriaceae bacterium]|jgi:hypothetical protein|nr:hypothetical protein [Propionibacteriaceae bacterium]
MNQYLLKPRAPRILVPAVLLVLAGGLCVGAAIIWPDLWGWWIAAAATGGTGIALLIAGLTALRRLRVWVELDDAGYAIYTSASEYTGAWRDIQRASVSKRHDKIALWHDGNAKTVIAHPAGAPDAEFRRLRRDIDRYLSLQNR